MPLPLRIAALCCFLALSIFVLLLRFNQPVEGSYAKYFYKETGYQNSDFMQWLESGLLLPKSAVPVRAPRPLYPAPIKLAQVLGITEDFTLSEPAGYVPQAINDQSVKVLLVWNMMLTAGSLWLFFSLSRYFGMSAGNAFAASILAGLSYGFNFWTAQMVPEVLSYFSVILSICLIVWACESKSVPSQRLPNQSFVRWALTGLAIGILVLGKEVYCLILLGLGICMMKRLWGAAILFVAAATIPTVCWLFYVIKVAHIFEPAKYAERHGFLVWFAETLFSVPFKEKVFRLSGNFLRQVIGTFQAFLFLPVLAALLGMIKRPVIGQWPYIILFFGSFSAMFFASNFIQPRICFMMWPVIFYYAWQGTIWLSEIASTRFPHNEATARVLVKVMLFSAMASIQFVEVYRYFFYG